MLRPWIARWKFAPGIKLTALPLTELGGMRIIAAHAEMGRLDAIATLASPLIRFGGLLKYDGRAA